MKRLNIAIFTLLTITTPSIAFSEEMNPCSAATTESTTKINEIRDKYSTITNNQSKDITSQAQKIKEDTPDGTGPDAAIKLDIDFRENIREFKLDLPSITMRTQNLSMDLPQTTMVTRTWSWDVPDITITQECRAGLDEVVWEDKTCHNDIPPFDYPCGELRTRRGPDICLPSPKISSHREEVKLDVPEIKMARTEWAMDVPEITMKTETIKINIPDLIVKNIEVAAEEQQKQSRDLSDKAKSSSVAISKAMTSEIQTLNKRMVTSAFACQKNQLKEKVREAYTKIGAMESTIAAAFNQAQSAKATDLIPTYENALTSIKSSKTKMINDYRAARNDLAKKEKIAIDSISVKEQVAATN